MMTAFYRMADSGKNHRRSNYYVHHDGAQAQYNQGEMDPQPRYWMQDVVPLSAEGMKAFSNMMLSAFQQNEALAARQVFEQPQWFPHTL